MFGRFKTSSRGGALRESVDAHSDVALLLQTVAKLQQQIEVLTGDGEALRGQLRMIQTGQSQASTGSVQSSTWGGGGDHNTIASRTSALESQTHDLHQRLVRLDKSVAEVKDYIDDQRSAAEFSKQLRVIEESGMMPPGIKIPRTSSPASSIRSSVYGGPFDDHAPYVGGLLPAPSFPRTNRALPPVGVGGGVGGGRDGRRRMDPSGSGTNRPYTGGPGVGGPPPPVGHHMKPGVSHVRASHGALPRVSPTLQPQRPPALAAIPSGWEAPNVAEAKAGRRAINSPSTGISQPQPNLANPRRTSPSPSGRDMQVLVEDSRDSFSALMAAVSVVGGAPPSPAPLTRIRPGQLPGSLGTPTGGSQHAGSAW